MWKDQSLPISLKKVQLWTVLLIANTFSRIHLIYWTTLKSMYMYHGLALWKKDPGVVVHIDCRCICGWWVNKQVWSQWLQLKVSAWWHRIVVPLPVPFILENSSVGVFKGGDNLDGGQMVGIMVYIYIYIYIKRMRLNNHLINQKCSNAGQQSSIKTKRN